MTLDSLPKLSDVIRSFSLSAKKSLGQNFLLDLNLTGRIARSVPPAQHLIEIGPGPGGLTRALLSEHPNAHVTVVEKDTRCLPALEQIGDAYPNRLTILQGDALELSFDSLAQGQEYRIVANLPYYISSEMMCHLLTSPESSHWRSLTLLFQKEFAQRLAADHNCKAYGRLSILAQALCRVMVQFDIPPSAFVPAPKVTSRLLMLTPHHCPVGADMSFPIKKLEKLTHAAFGQRRKMLRSALAGHYTNIDAIFDEAGLSTQARAETLSVQEYIVLAEKLMSSFIRNAP